MTLGCETFLSWSLALVASEYSLLWKNQEFYCDQLVALSMCIVLIHSLTYSFVGDS